LKKQYAQIRDKNPGKPRDPINSLSGSNPSSFTDDQGQRPKHLFGNDPKANRNQQKQQQSAQQQLTNHS